MSHQIMAESPASKRLRLNGAAVPILGRENYLSKLRAVMEPMLKIGAMYNSLVGGIVTDPELMTIPIHDHAIVRGHAVFDTCSVSNGRLYRVDAHLDRHVQSAVSARIPLPFGVSESENKEQMRSLIGQTVVASGFKRCSVRYYTSVGPGNFGVVPKGCTSAFYVVVYGNDSSIAPDTEIDVCREYTVDVPMKPPFLAKVKSNNYMLNVLTSLASQDKGGKFGILVDSDGNVAESAVLNCAFVTKDRRFITPVFDHILAGTTVTKALMVAQKLVAEGLLSAVSQEVVPAKIARESVEMMLMAGDCHLIAVTHWDDKPIGIGEPGEVAKRIMQLLVSEMRDSVDDHYELTYP